MMKNTDQERIKQSLKASEERLSLVLDATQDGAWDWNIITNEEFFSPRWCEIIGYSYEDSGLSHNFDSWKSRIHPDHVDRVMLVLTNHLENGTAYDIDYRHLHKSGEYRWKNSRGKTVRDKEGKPFRMVGCIRDITKRKETEQELENAIKKLNEALSEIKTLQGIIPICAYCHSIRDDEGAWNHKLGTQLSNFNNQLVIPACF